MSRVIKNLYIFFLILIPGYALASNISGRISLHDSWQPVVFLSSVDSPENLNVASPDFIIDKTMVTPDGSFSFENINLPADPRLYRLYLVKSKNAIVEFDSTVEKNFIYIIADNKSNIVLSAKASNTRFDLLEINDAANNQLRLFKSLLEEKLHKRNNAVSKTQRDFINSEIENYIRTFADSSKNSIVGLYALYQIDDRETDFLEHPKFYFNFQKKINAQFPNGAYSEAYDEMLNELVGFRELVCQIPGVAPKWKDYVMIAEGVVILAMLILLLLLMRKLKINTSESQNQSIAISILTKKEQQILGIMASGKTNKEIAAELFIELSTVKTHINNIYKQLKISNRNEAIAYYNSQGIK